MIDFSTSFEKMRKRVGHEKYTDSGERPDAMCIQRLNKEYSMLQREPVQYVFTAVDPANILDLHFVVHEIPDSPYDHGFYHGVLRFSPRYPMAPPSIIVFTPSGRFETGQRLCLSISDFHPESWNPMWSVATILVGFVSFMTEDANAVGSITQSTSVRRKLAARSLAWNVQHDKKFCSLFPDLVKLYNDRVASGEYDESKLDGSNSSDDNKAMILAVSGGFFFVMMAFVLLFIFTHVFHPSSVKPQSP